MRLDNFQDLGQMFKADKNRKKTEKTEPAMKDGLTPGDDEQGTCEWNHLRLQRKVMVQCWRVIGTISKAKRREDLLPILQRARDVGETTAKDIAEHLYFEANSRRRVAERLLQIAHRYSLLEKGDQGYGLTAAGVAALNKKAVFVPEQGDWAIWVTKDPLFPDRVLKVEPWKEPIAYSESAKKSKQGEASAFDELPSWLRKVKGDLLTTVDSGVVRLDELERKGEKVAGVHADLQLDWRVAENDLRLLGRLEEKDVNSVLKAPDLEPSLVWQQLLEQKGLWGTWDLKLNLLRIAFEDTLEAERNGMQRDIRLDSPRVQGFDRFDNVTVSAPLGALSADDARKWAHWRLRNRINDYATEALYERCCEQAVAPFAEFSPPLPGRDVLAEQAWATRSETPGPQVWYLMAASDWRL